MNFRSLLFNYYTYSISKGKEDSSVMEGKKKELTVEEMLEYFYEHFYSELSQEEKIYPCFA